MLNWLCLVDVDEHHSNVLMLRQPQTGLWFTNGEYLDKWLSGNWSMLWIHAKRQYAGVSEIPQG
jgi:hypothetical protein